MSSLLQENLGSTRPIDEIEDFEDYIVILKELVDSLRNAEGSDELENLINQYIVLEDTLIAGVEKFEHMILRPKETAMLKEYVGQLEKLTKTYQQEWTDEYWRVYRFGRGIISNISTSDPGKRNRLSLKLDSFRTGSVQDKNFDPLVVASEIDAKSRDPKPPANSRFISEVSHPDIVAETSETAPALQPSKPPASQPSKPAPPSNLPQTQLKHQDSSVAPRNSKRQASEEKSGGTACCAKCSLL